MNIHEKYGDYTLTTRWNPMSRVLQGIISSHPDVPIPHNALGHVHGIVLDIRGITGLLNITEIPDYHWAYLFTCDQPGDVVIVNGDTVGGRFSHAIRREWTMGSVLQHLKDCIDA